VAHCSVKNTDKKDVFKTTVKPLLSSHTREAQKVAAQGRWLLNRGEYQYKINIWEHFDWLLKTGGLLNRGDR